MIPYIILESWTTQQLYAEFKERIWLQSKMIGQLYPSILEGEKDQIVARSIELTKYHPNWFPEKGFAVETETSLKLDSWRTRAVWVKGPEEEVKRE